MATTLFFERYRLLGEANARLARATCVDAVLEVLRTHALAISGAEGVAVIRRDGDLVTYVGEDAIAPLWSGRSFPIRQCVSGLAILSRQPIVIPDITADSRVPMSAYLGTFVRSMAVFPLGAPRPLAALGLYWREARPFGRDVEELTTLLAQSANLAFQRLAQQLEQGRSFAGSAAVEAREAIPAG
jgi:GAF domain-containing protein